jgi:predicted RNase H-like HicB family nuclease
MKALHVVLEPGKDGFGAMIKTQGFENVFSFGESIDLAKENIRAAIKDLIMNYVDNGEDLPAQLKNIVPDTVPIRYSFMLQYYFELFPYLNVSQLAKKIGLNQSLMRQYHKGIVYASENKFLKIREGLRFVGKELEAVV